MCCMDEIDTRDCVEGWAILSKKKRRCAIAPPQVSNPNTIDADISSLYLPGKQDLWIKIRRNG